MDDFAARVDRRFDAVDRRFDAVDRRFDAIDRRLDRVDADIRALSKETNARFDSLQRTLLQPAAARSPP